MVLHPQARAALAAEAGQPRVHEPGYDVPGARSQAREAALAGSREPVLEVRDVDAGGVPARFYRPAADVAGLVLHLHGGGFVLHDVEVHDAIARRLANRSGLAVLSIDYRRPPEHPFPAAPDDASAVVRWLDDDGLDVLGLAPDAPVCVHGDSAGANLALVTALRHPGRFAAVVLVYPFLDPTLSGDSYTTAADGFDPEEARWFWQQYATTDADLEHPDLAPLRADNLHTLPATLVVTAEHDPLRDEGERLAAVLADLGVEVVGTRYLGMVHGFWRHPDSFDAAEPLMRQVAGFLGQHV